MKMLLEFQKLERAIFKKRPNRYIAQVDLKGSEETVHVHDPGRLKELLFEDNPCIIKYAASPTRKTNWDMIAAQKGDEYVLIHSGYHRKIAEALLSDPIWSPFGEVYPYKAEVKTGNSRLDFCLFPRADEKIWLEIKGCSLSENGVAMFPDAPTIRGRRHLEHLIDLKVGGERAAVIILILSDADVFVPKKDTDPDFYETFYKALEMGVEIYPIKVTFDQSLKGLMYGGLIDIQSKDESIRV